MAKITEDYCSKEIYRLLIKKGFDGEVHTSFDEEGYTQPSISIQMAMKWLREEHRIFIEIVHLDEDRHTYYLYRYHPYQSERYVQHVNPRYCTYEQACESAIKDCLENLI